MDARDQGVACFGVAPGEVDVRGGVGGEEGDGGGAYACCACVGLVEGRGGRRAILPPVTKMTLPEREGMSFAGLKSTWPRIAAMMEVVWERWTIYFRSVAWVLLGELRRVLTQNRR